MCFKTKGSKIRKAETDIICYKDMYREIQRTSGTIYYRSRFQHFYYDLNVVYGRKSKLKKEECWDEMHKHPDFGWIKDNDVFRPIIKIDKANIYYLEYGFKRTGITYSSFKESLELKFADGTPFGIKEE